MRKTIKQLEIARKTIHKKSAGTGSAAPTSLMMIQDREEHKLKAKLIEPLDGSD